MIYFLKKGGKKVELELNKKEALYRGPENGTWVSTYYLRKQQPEYEQLFQKELKKLLKAGFKITKTTADKPVKKLSKAEKLKAEAQEVLAMWKRDEYDNTKDALMDVRSLLGKMPKNSPEYKKFNNFYAAILNQARKDAKKDKNIAKYLKGLI